ncbi:carbohydrate binding family 9 domain-containing protein [Aestuariibacter sp. AA17]|uniref:Carbohydrate binding family 9 domain-containing protein n=1 Tax=Fluctibacter corallii TaxID=2984329 RepID=A0ABT3AAX1_9ALTE|nr:carbohydrate binding family 9 domain-containing protein [Aestuariibacter sp. AA17]MCV2885722.1 carbohydrate binding family 9 domain-containing protein [Aestuariibacter sp. AA17]
MNKTTWNGILHMAVIVCGLAFSYSLFAQNLDKTYQVPVIKTDVNIDGIIHQEEWAQAETITLDYVTRPYENTTPPVKTEVKIMESGDTLYLAFTAFDPKPNDIRAFYRDRDKVWSNDLIGVKLDPFNDSRLAYQFFVNPYGIQMDSIENEMTKEESDSWDAIWESKGRITQQGFEVEIALPLRIFNFSEGKGAKTWGAEFVRFYPRETRLRISNIPYDRNNACTLCQLGEIEGFEDAKQGKNLALIPTLVVGKGRSRDLDESRIWDDSNTNEVGIDVNWGVTPEISLQATINPDFSQVESDAAQLSINNTFALFFDEKRPFFLENADYFSTNYNLVYTRNIGAPDYGAKVTGRVDDHTFGVFIANDENATFLVPGNLGSSIATIEEESINVALRYRYDVSDDLSFGLINTFRSADHYHNYVLGFDTKYAITHQDTLRIQWVGSDTEYPDTLFKDFCDDNCQVKDDFSEAAMRTKEEDSFQGIAYQLNYRHEERDWFFRYDHYAKRDGFRADLGFVSSIDKTTDVIGGGYIWYAEDSWWNEFEISGDWDIHHTDNGELLEKESQIQFLLQAGMQSSFELGFETRDRVGLRHDRSILAIDNNTTLFHEDTIWTYFDFRPSSSVYFETFARYGDRIDFVNNRLGKEWTVEPNITLSLGEHFEIDIEHVYSSMDVEGERLYTANLTDARLSYQIDQRQLIRLILVYSDIERNKANYLDPNDIDARSTDFGAQLLYSYKLNPLTKFFVGYSSSGFEDDNVPNLTITEQSIFMKLSYAWLN